MCQNETSTDLYRTIHVNTNAVKMNTSSERMHVSKYSKLVHEVIDFLFNILSLYYFILLSISLHLSWMDVNAIVCCGTHPAQDDDFITFVTIKVGNDACTFSVKVKVKFCKS